MYSSGGNSRPSSVSAVTSGDRDNRSFRRSASRASSSSAMAFDNCFLVGGKNDVFGLKSRNFSNFSSAVLFCQALGPLSSWLACWAPLPFGEAWVYLPRLREHEAWSERTDRELGITLRRVSRDAGATGSGREIDRRDVRCEPAALPVSDTES